MLIQTVFPMEHRAAGAFHSSRAATNTGRDECGRGPMIRRLAWWPLFFAWLAGCANRPAAPVMYDAATSRELIDQSLPRNLADRSGWAADIHAAFTVQALAPNRENVCAVVAVIEQESSFQVNPVIPGLPAIARREIDRRAAEAGVPRVLVDGALDLHSSTGRSYSERISAAKTEKDLSDIFEDFISLVPMGKKLFADRNPIRTRGPMQVNVAFVARYAAATPYPYPIKTTLADEAFTRRGSLYFGVAHLLGYSAPYDGRYEFRFADYNAGQYASRNAAFQSALSALSGVALTADGALLPRDADDSNPGRTELAARAIAARLDTTDAAIHRALAQGKNKDFERTPLYSQVFSLAERSARRPLPRALVPRIKLQGPKITRPLTTAWYAARVVQRFKRCLSR
jgi:hypothetical protein